MNLRFPGQIYDKATGLHYNLNRYYNPLLGRYMEADPIGLEGGWNPYAYAGNDPINHADPTGLWSFGIEYYGRGSGGRFNISYDKGTLEGTVRIGVGRGAGIAFDPLGSPSRHAKPTGSEFIGRTTAKVDASIGVGNVGMTLGGYNASTGNGFVQPEKGAYKEKTSPSANFNPLDKNHNFKTGFSIGGSIGAELGGYINIAPRPTEKNVIR